MRPWPLNRTNNKPRRCLLKLHHRKELSSHDGARPAAKHHTKGETSMNRERDLILNAQGTRSARIGATTRRHSRRSGRNSSKTVFARTKPNDLAEAEPVEHRLDERE